MLECWVGPDLNVLRFHFNIWCFINNVINGDGAVSIAVALVSGTYAKCVSGVDCKWLIRIFTLCTTDGASLSVKCDPVGPVGDGVISQCITGVIVTKQCWSLSLIQLLDVKCRIYTNTRQIRSCIGTERVNHLWCLTPIIKREYESVPPIFQYTIITQLFMRTSTIANCQCWTSRPFMINSHSGWCMPRWEYVLCVNWVGEWILTVSTISGNHTSHIGLCHSDALSWFEGDGWPVCTCHTIFICQSECPYSVSVTTYSNLGSSS